MRDTVRHEEGCDGMPMLLKVAIIILFFPVVLLVLLVRAIVKEI